MVLPGQVGARECLLGDIRALSAATGAQVAVVMVQYDKHELGGLQGSVVLLQLARATCRAAPAGDPRSRASWRSRYGILNRMDRARTGQLLSPPGDSERLCTTASGEGRCAGRGAIKTRGGARRDGAT